MVLDVLVVWVVLDRSVKIAMNRVALVVLVIRRMAFMMVELREQSWRGSDFSVMANSGANANVNDMSTSMRSTTTSY